MRALVLVAGTLTLAVSTALASVAPAKPTPAKSTPAAATKAAPTPKPPKPAKPHTASGTVEAFDAAARTLTVKGTKATWTFNVAEARVWDGSRSVGLEDIAGRAGAKVTVKYTESGGVKAATSVRLAATRGGKSAKSQ